MRKFTVVLGAIMALQTLITPTFGFGKTTLDPNAPGAARTLVSADVDKRLAQKVTVTAAQKRLHDVIGQLSSMSGVHIYCGANVDDWRVRDIPVDVVIKDLPLRNVMNLLASATHTAYRKTEYKDQPATYRFLRDTLKKYEFTGIGEKAKKTNRAAAEWAWDTLSAYAAKADSLPAIDAQKTKDEDFDSAQIKLTAKLIASLGPAAKQKLFDGEQITLKAAGSPQSDIVKQLQVLAWTRAQAKIGASCRSVNDEDTQGALACIKMIPTDQPWSKWSNAGFNLLITNIPYGSGLGIDYNFGWKAQPVRMAKVLETIKELNIKPGPEADPNATKLADAPPKGFRQLKGDNEWKDWKLPALLNTFELGKRKDEKPMRFAEVLPQISEASGYSIICEDFESQKRLTRVSWFVDLGGCSAAGILAGMDYKFVWFIDEKNKVLLGTAGDWREKHLRLVQEKIITNIQAKQQTVGADIDEVAPIAILTDWQLNDWIVSLADPVCRMSDVVGARYRWVWELYNSLDKPAKEEVASDLGFSLKKYDITQLIDWIHQDRTDAQSNSIALYSPEEIPQYQTEDSLLTNKKALKSMVMRLVKVPVDTWKTYADPKPGDRGRIKPITHSSAEGIKRHTYELQLTGEFNGKPVKITSRLQEIVLPSFTAEREAELLKKNKADADKKIEPM